MLSIIAAFGGIFALLLCGAAAITLDPLALACGLTCAACSTFAIGLAVKP